MAGDEAMVRRGRPLGYVSQQVLEKIAVDRQSTSGQLSTALQLNRRHATVVCAKLASAGYLEVVARNGRQHVYSLPAAEAGSKPGEPTWFILGQALRP
jgi:hypothetical protein